MRGNRNISPSAAAVEFVPDDYSAPLSLSLLFRRVAPIEVDLGCGDGTFLSALAKHNPGRNFLGIDRMEGRVRSACKKIAQHGLGNVRILRVEVSDAVERILPTRSVSAFHLMFPDPWPKRRHARRRVVTTQFCDSIHRTLVDQGLLSIATDQLDYFTKIDQAFAKAKRFTEIATPPELAAARSTFEGRFVAAGLPIYRLVLRKISEPR
jgi:tRNA (guanine-N7-)-methyltransferase